MSASAHTTIKILYNDCYGGFNFSEEFAAAYKARTGQDVNSFERRYRVGPNSVRCDPVAVELFERLGAEKSSGRHASLAVREIPALFERYWSIDEYDGSESVCVRVDEAYADLLHQYMETGNSAALCDGYRAVRAAATRLAESAGYGVDAVVADTDAATDAATDATATATATAAQSPLLKRPSIVSEEEAAADDYARTVGYSYFGIGDSGSGSTGAGYA
jgi:hypothetical protein